jgi:hypothetical protein
MLVPVRRAPLLLVCEAVHRLVLERFNFLLPFQLVGIHRMLGQTRLGSSDVEPALRVLVVADIFLASSRTAKWRLDRVIQSVAVLVFFLTLTGFLRTSVY